MRSKVSLSLSNPPTFKDSLLQWAQQFDEIVWLDSNEHMDSYGSFDALLAVASQTHIRMGHQGAFEQLATYQTVTEDWLFGYLAYDLKNDVEHLKSKNPDSLGFPDIFFFQPKKIIRIKEGQADFLYLEQLAHEIEIDFKAISNTRINKGKTMGQGKDPRIHMGIFKDLYFQKVEAMQDHIHRGDIYEANFCQEFYANATIDPLKTFKKLNAISLSPFATFFRLRDKYLLCASPERYLKKIGETLISQPIKGTAKRSKDPLEDLKLKEALAKDAKELAENIMIVDLVRNDLSKSAQTGSVTVNELCTVYTFEQVHQMISTITARVDKQKHPVALLRETFPMGSMTGAPKIRAMQIIEELESFKRGVYSGAVGYFDPQGDFDFNVVIRSILYNARASYVSFSVGSAITAKADPEKEYEECLIKAKAMRQVLED
ncbi:MAG: aminodeoxychorismate synthase component I [Bacteroidota bacterium]